MGTPNSTSPHDEGSLCRGTDGTRHAGDLDSTSSWDGGLFSHGIGVSRHRVGSRLDYIMDAGSLCRNRLDSIEKDIRLVGIMELKDLDLIGGS